MSVNANEDMLAGNAALVLLILMLILMLLKLNTGYSDTDDDLCIRIMSLYFKLCSMWHEQLKTVFILQKYLYDPLDLDFEIQRNSSANDTTIIC